MTPIDEPASFEPGGNETKARKPSSPATSQGAGSADLIAFTLEPSTGRLIRAEAVDAAGTRRELSDDLPASLAPAHGAPTLESILEQAFEAGIDSVLGGEASEAEAPENEDDADLRRALLRSLIAHSAARRLMQPDVLSRAILGTLIAEAANSRASHAPPH